MANETVELPEQGEQPKVTWHSLSADDVLEKLETHVEQGLSDEVVEKRLAENGHNHLAEKPRPSFFSLVLAQLKSFVVILLIVASIISAILGEWVDAAAIMTIVVLNAIMGVVQESRAEEALAAMVQRLLTRVAFGRRLADQSIWEERIARARIDIEMTRLLCLKAADMMDRAGNKAAQSEIAMIKVQAPTMALRVIDDAVQAHGGGGVGDDFALAFDWAHVRTLRLADGPDEVHRRAIARAELKHYASNAVARPERAR